MTREPDQEVKQVKVGTSLRSSEVSPAETENKSSEERMKEIEEGINSLKAEVDKIKASLEEATASIRRQRALELKADALMGQLERVRVVSSILSHIS